MPPRPFEPYSELIGIQEALQGRYSIQHEIGRGGMGVVYLAHEVLLDRPVAIKALRPELATRPAFRDRFLREARTAARLSHPHIVPIHAVDQVGELVFIAMAYVEGETLGEWVRKRGPLSPTETAKVLREVAWALGYAHAQGVVHRDVKPDNILLESGTGRALVTDFGIAGTTHSVPDRPDVGADIMGTAEFMSPEQAKGETADGRSDLYSLGIVGRFALTGRLPFQGDTAAQTLARQIAEPVPALHLDAPGVPASLADALDRSMAKDPAARYPSGEALAAALAPSAARRNVPAAIRTFIEETHTQASALLISAGLGVYAGGLAVAGAVTGEIPWWALAGTGAAGAGLAAAPLAILVRKVRGLLKSGSAHDELVRALADTVEERRAALASSDGSPSSHLDRWLKRLTWGGFAAFGGGLVWLGWGPYIADPLLWTLYAGGMTTSAIAGVGGGVVSAVRGGPVIGAQDERWLRFWNGRLGRGVFTTAALRLDDEPAKGPGYRPTAVVIGMAADRLFRELPANLQSQFGELPSVVESLEADAEKLRRRITALDAGLADVSSTVRPRGPGGDGVHDVLMTSRDAALGRLADVVAALESIRLQLIRMHAGLGGPELLTERLGHARVLASDMERLVEGVREVDDLLGTPRLPDEMGTPTPV
jgi:tRNA A-37 threonylcarbamoyl transferase component Bud32